MKKALTIGLLACGMIFALASATPPPEEFDSGTSRRDAGSGTDTNTGGSDTSTGTDSGGGGTWNVNSYGAACTTDTNCPGGKCVSIFGASSTVAKACFKTCTAEADCADFPFPTSSVGCAALTSGATEGVCLGESVQNGPCGNVMNSGCVTDYGLCLMDSSGYGMCSRICDPANPSTCITTSYTSVCGCQGSDSCTSAWTSGGDGVCAPATTIGATCGFTNDQTGVYVPCTGDQDCSGVSSSSPTGTCQAAATDGGVGTDA